MPATGLVLAIFAQFLCASAHAKVPALSELYSFETQQELKLRKIRKDEIDQTRIALGRRSPSNRQAQLYLRLAELNLEAYRATYLLEGRFYESQVQKGETGARIDHTHSRIYVEAGLNASEQIVKLGVPYDRMDQVYYFLGFNYGELGQTTESLRAFQSLTQKYPSSPFVSEAYRALGDEAYGKADYRKSQAYYELGLKKNTPESLARIYHRLAWSYYKTRQFPRALETMKKAIATSGKSSEKLLSIREEGLRDIPIMMAETSRAQPSIDYLKDVAPNKGDYLKVLEKLARQFERNTRWEDATTVYDAILQNQPSSDQQFRTMARLTELDLKLGHFQQALDRLSAEKFNPGSEPASQQAYQNVKALVRKTATSRHEAYRRERKKKDLLIAESFYELYLSQFLAKESTQGEIHEVQMYLAEVKRDLGKPRDATQLYRQVLSSKDPRYAREAGSLLVGALSEAIPRSKRLAEQEDDSPEKEKNKNKPSQAELDFVEASDRLADVLKEGNDVREASLRSAQILAGYPSSRSDSLSRSRDLIRRWPKSDQAGVAARLWLQTLLDGLPDSKVFSPLNDAVTELNANRALLDADRSRGKRLSEEVRQARTRLKAAIISDHEKNERFKEAAQGYEEFAEETPAREAAERYYTDAVVSYQKVSEYAAIDKLGSRWFQRYPSSSKAGASLQIAATGALIEGEFPLSAQLFEKLGTQTRSPEALETAFRIFEGAGDVERTQRVGQLYPKLYPKSNALDRVLLRLGKFFVDAKKADQARFTFRQCWELTASELRAECGTRLGDLQAADGDGRQGRAIFRQVAELKTKRLSKRAASAVNFEISYARYRLGELLEKDAALPDLEVPESQISQAIQRRTNYFKRMNDSYSQAVSSGGHWGIAALDRLASWTMDFALDVDELAPSDPGMEKDLSEKVVKPLRKKAFEIWKEAYRKAVSQEILSPSIPRIHAELAKAGTPGFRYAQGPRGSYALFEIAIDGAKRGRELLLKSPKTADLWVHYGNTLLEAGKPLLAEIAYERALQLQPKNAGVYNNLAVLRLAGDHQEDSRQVRLAQAALEQSLELSPALQVALTNHATLLNYYSLFSRSKTVWEKVLRKASVWEAWDGVGIAEQSIGKQAQAEAAFERAEDLGAKKNRFSAGFRKAIENLEKAKDEKECVNQVADAASSVDRKLLGFEISAIESLKEACQ